MWDAIRKDDRPHWEVMADDGMNKFLKFCIFCVFAYGTYVVVVELIAEGDVSDVSDADKAEIAKQIASAAGVAQNDVVVTVSSPSSAVR